MDLQALNSELVYNNSDLPSGQIGSRLSLYRNGRGFESRQLQDTVFLNTLSISPVLTCSVCCADVESLYLI